MKKYLLTCGCIKEKKDLIRPRKAYKNRYTCPDHPEATVANRLFICVDCGQEFKGSARGGIVYRCERCREKYNEQNRGQYAKAYYHRVVKHVKTVKPVSKLRNNNLRDDSRWDCISRTDCLTVYDKFDCIPCKECKDYEYQRYA